MINKNSFKDSGFNEVLKELKASIPKKTTKEETIVLRNDKRGWQIVGTIIARGIDNRH